MWVTELVTVELLVVLKGVTHARVGIPRNQTAIPGRVLETTTTVETQMESQDHGAIMQAKDGGCHGPGDGTCVTSENAMNVTKVFVNNFWDHYIVAK